MVGSNPVGDTRFFAPASLLTHRNTPFGVSSFQPLFRHTHGESGAGWEVSAGVTALAKMAETTAERV
jgi:hypothetical protein